jgi:hypothetical protein
VNLHGSKVTCYSFNYDDSPSMAGLRVVNVEQSLQIDGSEKWAVRWMGRCVSRKGTISYEPQPSSRGEAWLKKFRFDDLDEALRAGAALAEGLRKWTPNVTSPPERVSW